MNVFLQHLLEEIKAASSHANFQSDVTGPSTEYTENIAKLQQFFDTIQLQADLDGETNQAEEDYWNSIKNQIDSKTFWNESIQNLIKLYDRIYSITESATEIGTDRAAVHGKIISSFNENPPQTFNSEEVRNGDAGNSFEPNSDWVKPWYNTDKVDSTYQKSYSAVRGDDKAAAALTSQNNLQFTREQAEDIVKQIRLLMPKNTRRVEIEDLNRNFWVIAQVITGISAYIFGEGSPYIGLLEGILKELVQLWENILYEWVGINFLTTEKVDNIHVEFLPIPIDSVRPYKKYDNFEYTDDINNWNLYLNKIQSNILYLKDKYNNSNLVVIPFFRINNYQKNYYSKLAIPYIVFYNQGAEKWSYCKLIYNSKPLIINAKDYKDFLYGARELSLLYRYTYPLSYAAQQYEFDGSHRYYGAVRPIPIISAMNDNDKIKITNFTLKIADGVRNIVNGENEFLIGQYSCENINEDTEEIELNYQNFTYPLPAIDFKNDMAEKAYYLGEMPSCYEDSAHQVRYNIVMRAITLVPLSYLWRNGLKEYFINSNGIDSSNYESVKTNLVNWFNTYTSLYVPSSADFTKDLVYRTNYNVPSAISFDTVRNSLWNGGVTSANEAYARSLYDWNARALLDSLTKTDLFINNQNVEAFKDIEILYKKSIETEESFFNENTFIVMVGSHNCEFWRKWNSSMGDEAGMPTYYGLNSNSLLQEYEYDSNTKGNYPVLQYYPHTGHAIGKGAVLYRKGIDSEGNPFVPSIYKEYYNYNYVPYAFVEKDIEDIKYQSQYYYYVVLTKKSDNHIVKANNWAVMFVSVCFGINPKPEISQNSEWKKYLSSIKSNLNRTFNNGAKPFDTMICNLKIHFFLPNNQYFAKMVDRYDAKGYESLPTDMRNFNTSYFENWVVSYNGSDGVNNATIFETLYCNNQLSNYTPTSDFFDPETQHFYNGDEYQISGFNEMIIDDTIIPDMSNSDFMRYPNKGIPNTEETHVYIPAN